MVTEALPTEGPFSNHRQPPEYFRGTLRFFVPGENPGQALKLAREQISHDFELWEAGDGAILAAQFTLSEFWQNAARYAHGPRKGWYARTFGGAIIGLVDFNDGKHQDAPLDVTEPIVDEFDDTDTGLQIGGLGLEAVANMPEIIDCGSVATREGNEFWAKVVF